MASVKLFHGSAESKSGLELHLDTLELSMSDFTLKTEKVIAVNGPYISAASPDGPFFYTANIVYEPKKEERKA